MDLFKKYLELNEALRDRIYDKGHSPERLQKTLDKAREHEKSYFEKRAGAMFSTKPYNAHQEFKRLNKVRDVMTAARRSIDSAQGTSPKPFTGRIGRKY